MKGKDMVVLLLPWLLELDSLQLWFEFGEFLGLTKKMKLKLVRSVCVFEFKLRARNGHCIKYETKTLFFFPFFFWE